MGARSLDIAQEGRERVDRISGQSKHCRLGKPSSQGIRSRHGQSRALIRSAVLMTPPMS